MVDYICYQNVFGEDGLDGQSGSGFVGHVLEGAGDGADFGDAQVRSQVARIRIDQNDAHQKPNSQEEAQGQGFTRVIFS